MELNSRQKRQRVISEIKDLLAGAAFPFMLQLVLSVTVIMFADYNGDVAIQGFALAVGELMLIAAYVIFGIQNGVSSYRKTVAGQKKRELQSSDTAAYFKTGEYALWKGAAIGAISAIPFIIFQLIGCVAPNKVCEFILKYAFGWAVYPFAVAGINVPWLNFIWLIIPVGVHTAAYFRGGLKEKKRQQTAAAAQGLKDKKKK